MNWYAELKVGTPPIGWVNEFKEGYKEVTQEVRGIHEQNPLFIWDGTTLVAPPVFQPPPPTQEDIIAGLQAVVQNHLDSGVKERLYDSILSACSYATSSNSQFAAEGKACVVWRDACWQKCYDIVSAVLAGSRSIPSSEALVSELPVLVWPASSNPLINWFKSLFA